MAEHERNARLHLQIDRNLIRVYEETLQQEVPDRFTALLAALRDKERQEGVKS